MKGVDVTQIGNYGVGTGGNQKAAFVVIEPTTGLVRGDGQAIAGEGFAGHDFDWAISYRKESCWGNPIGIDEFRHGVTFGEAGMVGTGAMNPSIKKMIDAQGCTFPEQVDLFGTTHQGDMDVVVGEHLQKSPGARDHQGIGTGIIMDSRCKGHRDGLG
jgi:hypothetical protein